MRTLELELRAEIDGSARLNHWDMPGGEDTVLRISPDGSVYELSFPDGSDDETEIWTPVDLAARLLTLCDAASLREQILARDAWHARQQVR